MPIPTTHVALYDVPVNVLVRHTRMYDCDKHHIVLLLLQKKTEIVGFAVILIEIKLSSTSIYSNPYELRWIHVCIQTRLKSNSNRLPKRTIFNLGSGCQKNPLQRATYQTTQDCSANKFPLPLPIPVGPTK